MQLKITVQVLAEETDNPNEDVVIAQGEITGGLDLKKGNPDGQPILTVKMRNILDQVRETIYADSNE